MPRFYCDYCDAYLTHDSMSGRQQHMRGWKHRENVKLYYQTHFPQWAMEQQALQMQDPQYLAMMQGGFVPPGFGTNPADPNQELFMQQQQQQMAMQQQMQLQHQQMQQMQQMQQPPPQMMPPMMPLPGGQPPIFRAPPSMAPPASMV